MQYLTRLLTIFKVYLLIYSASNENTMTMVFEDSRMSLDGSDLSNLSPCKATTKTSVAASILPSTILEDSDCQQPKPVDKTNETCTTASDRLKELQKQSNIPSPIRKSWIEMIEEEENARLDADTEINMEQSKSAMELGGSESKMSIEEVSNTGSTRDGKSNRQIEIDILDSANVEKYEKLVRDDKIKSPFKRRLSNDEEDGNDDGHAKYSEDEPDPPPNQHKKSKMSENDHGRERFRCESSSSGDASSQTSRKPIEYEKDIVILERRQKQIDYGKNTLGYENYCKQIPKDKRSKDHPKTPPKHIKYSRRAWDGLVKVWRKKLHCFDPDAKSEADA